MSTTSTTPPNDRSASASPAPRSRGRRWLRRLAIAVPCLLVAYTLFGFFGVPLIARKIVVPRLSEHLTGDMTLDRMTFNPFTLHFELHGLDVSDDQGERALGVESVVGNFELVRSILDRGWTLRELTVAKPYVGARVRDDGTLNLLSLVRPESRPTEPLTTLPRVIIGETTVAEGEIELRDRSLPEEFDLVVEGVSFTLSGLDTGPDHDNPAILRATTDSGAEISWDGTLTAQPLASTGRVVARNIDMPRFMPYGLAYTDGRVEDGRLSFELSYEARLVQEPRMVNATLHTATIEDFRTDRLDETVIEAPSIVLTNAVVDLDSRTLVLESYEQTGGSLKAERYEDGVLSLVQMLVAGQEDPADSESGPGDAAANPTPTDPETGAPRVDPLTIQAPIQQLIAAVRNLVSDATGPWDVTVESATVTDHRIDFTDQAVPRPVSAEILVKSITAGPVRSAESYAIPFDADLETGDGGTIASNGTLALFDRSVDLTVTLSSMDVERYAAYVPVDLPPVRFAGATLDLDGTLKGAGTPEGELSGTWSGTARLSDVLCDHLDDATPILTLGELVAEGTAEFEVAPDGPRDVAWDGSVELNTIDLDAPTSNPLDVTVSAIAVGGQARITRDADGAAALSWTGDVDLSTAAVETATAETPLLTGAERLGLKGDLEGTFQRGAAPRLVYRGGIKTGGATLEAPQLAGPVNAGAGLLEIDGESVLVLPADAPIDIDFSGTVTLSDGRFAAPERHEAEATVTGARFEGVVFDQSERSATVTRATLENPVASAAISALPSGSEPETAAGTRRPGRILDIDVPYRVVVDELSFRGGAATLRDEKTDPPLTVKLDAIEFQGTNLSTTDTAPATVTMTGKVQETGRMEFDGTLDLLGDEQSVQATLNLVGVPLPPHSSISGYYAGYKIDDGRLTTTVPITITGTQLNGELEFEFDHIVLGEKVDSPAAPDVPLDLGISLLKDANDKVTGSVPFEGDMADPEFELGDLIFRAFFSLIGKIATAPFQLLAGAFGGGEDEDISFVAFEPGTSDLAATAPSKLDVLGRAMNDRTTLRLVVVGTIDPTTDVDALRSAVFREELAGELGGFSASLSAVNDQVYRDGVTRRFQALPPEAGGGSENPDFETMEAAVLATVEVPQATLLKLAAQRASVVAGILRSEHDLGEDRMRAAAPDAATIEGDGPHVIFEIE